MVCKTFQILMTYYLYNRPYNICAIYVRLFKENPLMIDLQLNKDYILLTSAIRSITASVDILLLFNLHIIRNEVELS